MVLMRNPLKPLNSWDLREVVTSNCSTLLVDLYQGSFVGFLVLLIVLDHQKPGWLWRIQNIKKKTNFFLLTTEFHLCSFIVLILYNGMEKNKGCPNLWLEGYIYLKLLFKVHKVWHPVFANTNIERQRKTAAVCFQRLQKPRKDSDEAAPRPEHTR